eukprot:scaffold8836_cov62-Phaeocystis_antarctica.AAC.1
MWSGGVLAADGNIYGKRHTGAALRPAHARVDARGWRAARRLQVGGRRAGGRRQHLRHPVQSACDRARSGCHAVPSLPPRVRSRRSCSESSVIRSGSVPPPPVLGHAVPLTRELPQFAYQ